MPLTPGTLVGPYEILGQIGVGGMGEVYRAKDTGLHRDVAIKVLPDEFAQDAERLARFEREARTLASLNHPGIATIHGLEKTGTARALVMEFVDGPTLADRIAEGPVPVDEALAVVRQIADALEAAHDQGIVHRDLKPANIKLRPDGTVKVLDFGLAKTIEPSGAVTGRSMSPTITTPAMTQAGVILGTAAYMSPEQAKGRAVDKRSDVWALGCVCYELMTGKRAFDGEDVSETLASILRSEPDWTALPSDLPPAVVALLKRMLEKDRRQRVADVAAVSFVLNEPQLLGRAATTPRRSLTMWIAVAGIAAVALAGVAWSLMHRDRTDESRIVTRLTVSLKGDQQSLNLGFNSIALSPDGRLLAYAAAGRLYLRPLDRLEPMLIPGTESSLRTAGTTRRPQFSPDSKWLAFYKDGEIRKVSVAGGLPVSIVAAPPDAFFFWGTDGSIAFLRDQSLLRVPPNGDKPVTIGEGLTGRIQSLQLLPGGQSVLLTRFPPNAIDPASSEVLVRSLATGREDVIVRGGSEALYLPTGHLLYYSNGSLLALEFDLHTLATTGAPTPVADKVLGISAPALPVAAVHVAVSPQGTLAYVTGERSIVSFRSLVWVDRTGHEEPVGFRDDSYVSPRLSPNGRFVAATMRTQFGGDIWILDLDLKTARPFATDPSDERSVTWMPDGKHVAFGSARDAQASTWWQAADGSGTATRLAGFPLARFTNFYPTSVTPKGDVLLITAGSANSVADLWTLRIADRETKPLIQTSATERNGEISPDGRWLAYDAFANGESNIWVQPFPNVSGGKWQVTTGGATQAVWSRDGKELFYLDGADVLTSVRVEDGTAFAVSTPMKVLPRAYVSTVATYAGRQYDVSPDGKRFLMMKDAGIANDAQGRSIIIVENFFDELRKR